MSREKSLWFCSSFAMTWSGLGLLALVLSMAAVASWEQRLEAGCSGGGLQVQAYGAAGTEGRTPGLLAGPEGSSTFQQISEHEGSIAARYGFLNFNSDPVELGFSIPKGELLAYDRDYGYDQGDLDDLQSWQKDALDEAYQAAVKNRWSQDRLNALAIDIQAEYRSKHRHLLVSRGFKLLSETLITPDIPQIVGRNVGRLRPVALQLSQTAKQRGYEAATIVGTALALVQTALVYQNVPLENGGRMTGGILPPVTAMAAGKGDCDSKSALLASILLNWDQIKLVGLGVPSHYLLGYLQNPAKGEVYVDYQGLRYVLLEPAGPAWLAPGTIAATTLDLLNAGNGLSIEPLTAN